MKNINSSRYTTNQHSEAVVRDELPPGCGQYNQFNNH